jgi:hypothetical protein
MSHTIQRFRQDLQPQNTITMSAASKINVETMLLYLFATFTLANIPQARSHGFMVNPEGHNGASAVLTVYK